MVSAQLLWLTWRGRKNQEGIMRLVTYEIEHKSGLGVISKDGRWIYPLTSLDMDYKTMQELIENISDSEKQLLDYASGQDPYKIKGAAPMEEVCLKAPIPYAWALTTWPMQRNPPVIRRKNLTGKGPLRFISQRG